MDPFGKPKTAVKTVTVPLHLSESDYEILEKFRGDLSADAFVSVLLRMIDSGSVQSTPDWVKGFDQE